MDAVNLDEKIGKVVGKRKMPRDMVAYGLDLQTTVAELCPLRIPRGVYKFRTHEEADQWLMAHMTKQAN